MTKFPDKGQMAKNSLTFFQNSLTWKNFVFPWHVATLMNNVVLNNISPKYKGQYEDNQVFPT